jgi:hypothetical protein
VSTDDSEVKGQLRQLGEPICKYRDFVLNLSSKVHFLSMFKHLFLRTNLEENAYPNLHNN